ncbi:transmembrane protein 218 [Ixodes scapularis]|uniref:transmembrane protein 218 n=1 Tax=Ixodes scapularis TaxID=6945 RepID=UPI001A9E184A|nr:transmembrane protein 218 [Ixodes scapularis]
MDHSGKGLLASPVIGVGVQSTFFVAFRSDKTPARAGHFSLSLSCDGLVLDWGLSVCLQARSRTGLPWVTAVASAAMAHRVFDVGIGVFILAVLWSCTFLLCGFLSKTKGQASAAGVFLLAVGLTAVLLAVPRGESQLPGEQEDTDPLFIWRNALTVLLGLCSLVSPFIMLKMHWAVPVHAKSLDRQSAVIRRRTVTLASPELSNNSRSA